METSKESGWSVLTPEQFAVYEGIVNEIERFRGLSPEEKEALILDIVSRPYLDLLCDWAFKHVFGHHPDLLMMLLNDFLPERIVGLEYLPNEADRWKGNDKNIIMDVLCRTEDGREIIVEMQQQDRKWLKNRLLYYGCAMIRDQLKPKEKYADLHPVYVICLMNFKLKHAEDRLIYTYRMQETHSGEAYGDQLSIYLCELPRLAKQAVSEMNPVEAWFYILKNSFTFTEESVGTVGSKFAPVLDAARTQRLSTKDRIQYFRVMITEEDREDIALAYLERGLEMGREEGRAQTNRAHALKMTQLGIDVSTIEQVTGLSAEEISCLR